MLLNNRSHSINESRSSIAGKSHQDNPGRVFITCINEPSEVLVFRQQDTILFVCSHDQLAIIRTLHGLRDCKHIKSIFAQRTHDGKITTFVRQKTKHVASCGWLNNDRVVANNISGIRQSSLDIFS